MREKLGTWHYGSDSSMDDRNEEAVKDCVATTKVQIPLWTIGT